MPHNDHHESRNTVGQASTYAQLLENRARGYGCQGYRQDAYPVCQRHCRYVVMREHSARELRLSFPSPSPSMRFSGSER